MALVFYDIETTIPTTDMIEFGGIVLDERGMYEKKIYTTLIHSGKITARSVACNGITPEMVLDAPEFEEVADSIYNILHNNIWAGHNIKQFDNPQIVKHFQRIGRTPPQPLAVIDTLPLLRSTFGKRAGDMKMASLGNYFGLGQEQHRAIEDCRMTIEVLKNCTLTMFLEEHVGYAEGRDSPAKLLQAPGDRLLAKINQAMSDRVSIWISYDGGSIPLRPRCIEPLGWYEENRKLHAFCLQSGSKKIFIREKIIEIQDKQWG